MTSNSDFFQGEIVEVLKRRKRNAPIEMWIDTMENTVSEVHQSADQSVSDKAADYSPLVPKLLQVKILSFNG